MELKSSHGGELDHNFLMEIMEENEKIEETDDLSVLTEIEERNLGTYVHTVYAIHICMLNHCPGILYGVYIF